MTTIHEMRAAAYELQAKILLSLSEVQPADTSELAHGLVRMPSGLSKKRQRPFRQQIINNARSLRRLGWKVKTAVLNPRGKGYLLDSTKQCKLLLAAFIDYKFRYEPEDGPLTPKMVRAFVDAQVMAEIKDDRAFSASGLLRW